jgi:hypothetical protein
MDAFVVLEWKYSPPDYFESQIEIKEDDYTMIIANGKAEAKIDSAVYDATPSMRDTLHDMLNSRFLGVQLCNHKVYVLLSPDTVHVHTDGHKNRIVELKGHIECKCYVGVDIKVCDKDGNVVGDSKRDRIEKVNGIADLVSKHRKDAALMSLLKSHDASLRDPDDGLVHLYEIRDALCRKFSSEDAVRSALKIPKSKLSRFRQLCNDEPLRQGRHRGKKYETLRDATGAELSEVHAISITMIEAYVHYLEMIPCSIGPK